MPTQQANKPATVNRPHVARGGGALGNTPVPSLISSAMRAHPVLSVEEERDLTRRVAAAHAAAWGACLGPRCVRPTRRAAVLLRACDDAGVDHPAGLDDAALSLADLPAVVAHARRRDPDQRLLRAAQAVTLADCDDVWTSPRASADSVRRAEAHRYEVLSAARDLARLEDRMVRHNLGLAVACARAYAGHMPVADLVQEGCVGLLAAVRRFDPAQGYRFSTFATWRVRFAVSRYVANHRRAVRLPVHLQAYARELARMSGEAVAALDAATDGAASRDVLNTARALLVDPDPVISLQAPLRWSEDGNRATLSDLVADPGPSPEAFVARHDLDRALGLAISRLDARTADVVRLVAGLGADAPTSTAEVAAIDGASQHVIAETYRRAVRAMRRCPELAAMC